MKHPRRQGLDRQLTSTMVQPLQRPSCPSCPAPSSTVQHRHTLLLVEPWSGRCEGTDKNRPWVCARASFVGHREASEHLSTQALTSPDRGSLRDASLANTGWRPQAKKKNSIRDEIVRNRQSIFCNGMASSLPYGRAHVFFKRVPSLPDTAPSL